MPCILSCSFRVPHPIHIFLVILLLLTSLLPPPKCPFPFSLLRYSSPNHSSTKVTSSDIPPNAPRCQHAALFSAARHGSTWLIDTFDNCRYSSHLSNTSDERPTTYSDDVFARSELWTDHGDLLRSIMPSAAASYCIANASVKLLPPHATKRPADVRSFFSAARDIGIPVVVLRRNLSDAWESLVEARQTGNWMSIKRTGNRRKTKNRSSDREWEVYETEMEEYFQIGKRLLVEAGVRFDEVWYDEVVDKERLWFEKAGCFVRNCNFAQWRHQ